MLTANPASARKYDILSPGEVMIHRTPVMKTPGGGKPMQGADSRADR